MPRTTRAVWALTLASLVWGGIVAYRLRWTTDDAFISFRYARNLVDGLGLVFNAGERVEGYSNFLWTVWTAVGLRAGVTAEGWANAWSIACYLGTIALLGWAHLERRRELGAAVWTLPLAALGAALHPDWNAYATGGLETSLFTLLLVAGWWLVSGEPHPRRLGAAGLVFAAAALTRPDGVLPALVGGL
ncbi:MAG TPA: hypothetical protein VJS92_05345, partial [Candidatus Polarisedimenticolaceae bacterium]|nr:hypothetical protein [Candidatus Polarisedimenticolaceae bacterium]